VIAPATLSWLDGVVVESDQTERGARQRSLKALRAESERLQTRIDTMYMDRLDGRISAAFFDAKSEQWRLDQKQIHERIQTLQSTELMTAARAVEIVRGVSEACAGFEMAKSRPAAGARGGTVAECDVESRAVRVSHKIAVPQIGALELRKPKKGKGETGFGAGN
jgi:hypothetical protein